jgi:hypothetical protein
MVTLSGYVIKPKVVTILFFTLYSQAHQLRSSSFYFILKSEITFSVWQNIIHACFENIGYLIDFEE